MITKSKHLDLFLILTLCVLGITSCEKDNTPDPCADEDFGTFRLLHNARHSIPYWGYTTLYFQDSIGNQVEFELDFAGGGYKAGDRYYISNCDQNNNIEKKYKTNCDFYKYKFIERTQTLNLHFVLELKVEPFSFDYGSVKISDQLWFNQSTEIDSNLYTRQLTILVNSRDLNEEEIKNFTHPFPTINLLGKTFYNVYTNFQTGFYYSFDLGIIAFLDRDEKLWVLNESENKK